MIDMSVSHSHTFAQAQCPPGYVGSGPPDGHYPPHVTHFCVGDPILTCPSGYTLNTANKQCEAIRPAGATCQSGFTYDPSTRACVQTTSTPAQPECSPGFSFDTSTSQCIAATSTAAQPGCSTGTFDSASGQCVETTTTAANPSCQTGTFDSTTGQCVSTVPPTCPSGYDLTRILGTEDFSQCESVVSPCLSHGLLTVVSGLGYTCTDTPISNDPITCASGFEYSQVAFTCIAPLQCPSGYTLTSNRSGTPACAEFAAVICPQGSTYDVTTRTCQPPTTTTVAPVYYCNTGTLDSSTNQCVSTTNVAATYTCPSGGTLDSSGHQCVSTNTMAPTYTCPSGGTLDSSGHQCVSTATSQPTYVCQSGRLDPSTNQCIIGTVSPTPVCTAGYYFPPNGRCYVAVSNIHF